MLELEVFVGKLFAVDGFAAWREEGEEKKWERRGKGRRKKKEDGEEKTKRGWRGVMKVKQKGGVSAVFAEVIDSVMTAVRNLIVDEKIQSTSGK